MIYWKNALLMFSLCALCVGLEVGAHAQTARVTVKTVKCERGKLYYPTNVTVSILDKDKTAEIMQTVKELKSSLAVPNVDDSVVQKSEEIYERLRKMVASSQSLAQSKSLHASRRAFSILLVKRVVVFGFENSEYESLLYSIQEVNVLPDHENVVTLDFTSEVGCKAGR